MILLPLVSFNSGEASPWLAGRVDLEKYGSLCTIAENWILTPYGGVRRRPGFEFVHEVRDSSKPARLLPFSYSTEDGNYVLVLNDGKMRIARGGALRGYVGTPTLEIAHPWADAELRQVQIAQFNDVAYLTHPNHDPQKLTRLADDDWTLAAVDFDHGAMQDLNTTDTTLAPSATTGAGVDLVASADTFLAGHVGARFKISHDRAADDFERVLNLEATGDTESSVLLVNGDWQVTTSGLDGSWEGTLKVQTRPIGGGAWTVVRQFDVQGDRNISAGGRTDELVEMSLNFTWTASTGNKHRAVLEALDGTVSGEVEITTVTDAQNAVCTVKHPLFKTDATVLWNEGAFSDVAGFPAAVTFHDGRLWFGGTKAQPQNVFGSTANDYENFLQIEGEDDESISHPLTSGQRNTIRWMISERRLLVGTSGREHVCYASGNNEDSKLTPSNITDRSQSNYGSAPIQAQFLNDSLLYAQRHARKVREYGYVFDRDRYVASDVTLLGEHITDEGVLELTYQQQRDSILWAVTAKGALIGMTYEKEQNVIGWHRHSTPGDFESVAVIFGEDEEDEVWCIVERTIDGATKRYLERMKPDQYRIQEADDKVNYQYADSSVRKTLGPATKSVPGLAHLEGETVGVLVDGAQQPDRTVAAAAIETERAGTEFVVGLRYASRLQPLSLHVTDQSGTVMTKEGRINRLGVRFWHSLGGHYGESAEGDVAANIAAGLEDPPPAGSKPLFKIKFRDTADPMDSSPPPYTGVKEFDFPDGTYELETTVAIVNDSMYPMAILGLVPKAQWFGDDEGDD